MPLANEGDIVAGMVSELEIEADQYASMGDEDEDEDEEQRKRHSSSVLEVVHNPSPKLLALANHLHGMIRAVRTPIRQPKASDDARFRASLLSFTHALATNALMRIPAHNGISVAFNTSKYTGLGTSVTALRQIRDTSEDLGLIVYRNGFNSPDKAKSFTTGIRHTAIFGELVRSFEITMGDLIKAPTKVIAIRDPVDPSARMPLDVRTSATVLRRYNRQAQAGRLILPQEAWDALLERVIAADPTGRTHKLHRGYDEQRVYLTRRFAMTWERGGRHYDGFWQSMPKDIRSQLLIDGEPTVELDYSRLHPRMLYNREGLELEDGFDPYTVPGFSVPTSVAKETFNRLLNSRRKITCRKEDKAHFKNKGEFNTYRDAMIAHLKPIAHKFQSDEGAKLQKIDSDLALKVMDRCMDEGIAVYPVHDSFIVTENDAESLRNIMLDEYENMMGFPAKVK